MVEPPLLFRLLRVLPFPLIAFAIAVAVPGLFALKDFPEYWSAARVLATGGDPYDGSQLRPVQEAAQPDGHIPWVVSLWTPPWTLPVYLPIGLLPFATARYVWLFVQLGILFFSAEWLWRTYADDHWRVRLWWVPHALAFCFAPTFAILEYGQNPPLLLLGLTGFACLRERRPLLAGLFLSLAAIKPHLFAAVGVVVLLDVVRPGGWKVLLGGGIALAVGTLIAVACKPDIFHCLIEAVRRPHTADSVPLNKWVVPISAYRLRLWLAPDHFWVQFVPCGVASLGAAVYFVLRRRTWHWPTELPRLLLISLLFAPYGGWLFDLVVLLIPVLIAALRCGGLAFGLIHLAAAVTACLQSALADHIWLTPLVAVLFFGVTFVTRRYGRDATPTV